MTNAIKEFKQYRLVTMRDGTQFEVDEQVAKSIQLFVTSDKALPYQLLLPNGSSYTKYDFGPIIKKKVTNSIEEYIMNQPKNVRDKLRIIRPSYNSIEHASNYVQAINDGKL